MQAGRLDKRAAFHRRNATTDGFGNVSTGFSETPFLTVWASIREREPNEREEAGALASTGTAVLRVRHSAAAAGVAVDDQVRVGGVVWNIRGIVAIEGARQGWIDMQIEKGVA